MKIVSGYPHGACSFYRSNGVFPKLNIQTEMISDINWQSLVDTDVVMIERPSDNNYYSASSLIKDFNVKLWIDYDDNFFCLPDWNPAKGHYGNKDVQAAIIKCMQRSDVITVATEGIKKGLTKYKDEIEVIPNAFNDYNYKFENRVSNKKVIFWRGSTTHRGDLLQYKHQMTNVANNNKDWRWYFIGNDLWYITESIENKKELAEQHLINYFVTIKKVNPSIYIVPLAFNEFNECKSNCGWLEATYAGAVTLAPDMPEWRKPGILLYQTPEEFEEQLNNIIADDKLRAKCYNLSYEYIKENFLLSNINQKRKEILEKLLEK